jgi:hypothetical protein
MVSEIIGWDELCFVVVQILVPDPELEDHDEGFNHLDQHHQPLRFYTEPDCNDGGNKFKYVWLQVNDPDIESSIELVQLMPDFRRQDRYFMNGYEANKFFSLPNVTQGLDYSTHFDGAAEEDEDFTDEELFD